MFPFYQTLHLNGFILALQKRASKKLIKNALNSYEMIDTWVGSGSERKSEKNCSILIQ